MKHLVSNEDRLFRDQFESCEFPVSDFDHRNHIRLAYIYLVENDSAESALLIRESLNRVLHHNGVDPAKYHETMTQAWILAVLHFMQNTEQSDSAASFILQNPKLLDTKIMLTHYSTKVLFSEQARRTFLQPDLEPIPGYE